MKYAYQVLSVVLCLFVLLAVNISLNSGDSWLAKIGNGLAFSEFSRLALFAMIGLLLVFLDRPIVKNWEVWPLKIINWGMMAATVVVFGYIFVQSDAKFSAFWVNGDLLGNRAGNEAWFDFVIAGIGIGLIVSLFFILYSTYFKSLWISHETVNGQKVYRLTLAERVFFINKGNIQTAIQEIEPGSKVIVDASNTVHMDQDAIDIFNDFKTQAEFDKIEIEWIEAPGQGKLKDPARVQESQTSNAS